MLSEYDKKYKKELSEYIRNQPIFGENKFSLDFMHDFCYTLYLKYDELIAKDHKKTSLALGHSIIMICDSTKLLKKCFQDQDYSPFVNYK